MVVHDGHVLQSQADGFGHGINVPEDVSQFVGDLATVEGMSLEEVLLYKIRSLSGFAA